MRSSQLYRDVKADASSGDGTTPAHASGATPPQVFRRITVCGQYQNQHRVPSLRLSGKWLRQAGFDLGQKAQVKVDAGRLTICAEKPQLHLPAKAGTNGEVRPEQAGRLRSQL